jgi:voltage-gated potassium channel
VLFYVAEKDKNSRVNTIFDALEYCSSSLSVGYTSIYPSTPIGKVVATLLMTYGPALSGAMLDGPKKKGGEEVEGKILAALEEILAELRKKT